MLDTLGSERVNHLKKSFLKTKGKTVEENFRTRFL